MQKISAMATKRIPYGKTDFVEIMTDNRYYVDKTQYIELIEQAPDFLFLIRPRRFGKSLFLNMLSAYYDINNKERFGELFGNLDIGKHPTESRNKYLILSFNFSNVNTDEGKLNSSFEEHCNQRFLFFAKYYKNYFDDDFLPELQKRTSAEDKLQYVSTCATLKGLSIYLFIDEYDKFANTILSSPMDGHERYKALTHGGGFYKNFFTYVKTATTANDAAIKKMFITGVSPVTMDDVTSGFNIGTNITIDMKFNSILGFNRDEVIEMMNYYKAEGMIKGDLNEPLSIMEQWYDNYCFAEECIGENVFNSDMVLYFLNYYLQYNTPPKILIDSNVRTDYGKLRHFIILDKKLNGNFSVLKQIAENGEVSADINTSFPMEELTKPDNFISLLFYFGILTISDIKQGTTVLKVPNLTIQKMLMSYITESYKDAEIFNVNVTELSRRYKTMAYEGNWKDFFQYMAQQVSEQTRIRDYIYGEKAIQTLHAAYMNLYNYYILHSEYEMNFGHGDLWMQPNFIQYKDMPYSYIIEFKYVKHDDKIDMDALREEATRQLRQYSGDSRVISTKRGTELKLVYVIYHGWEMVECESVSINE